MKNKKKNLKKNEIKRLLNNLLNGDNKFPKFLAVVNLDEFIKKNKQYITKLKNNEYKILKILDDKFEENMICEYFGSKIINDKIKYESNIFLKKNNFNQLLHGVLKRGLIYKK